MKEVRPWDLLNPNQPRSQEDIAKNRLSICESCEYFIKLTHQCNQCGCIMPLKVKLENATCPKNFW